MKSITRRDAMKMTALAGVTGATCLSLHAQGQEKPDHLEVGQLWRREGLRNELLQQKRVGANVGRRSQ